MNVNDKKEIKNHFLNDEVGTEMYECVQSLPPRFREEAIFDVFNFHEDREMWDLKTVAKAWTYFLEEIVPEMTEKEKREYDF